MSDSQVRLLAERAGVAPAVMAEALEWLVQLWSNEMGAQARAELDSWLADSAERRRAWQAAQRIDQRLSAVANPAAATGLRSAHKAAVSRRQALQLLGLVGVGLLGGYSAQRSDWLARHRADLHTATGERRRLTLSDGSQLVLNTATAVDLYFDDRQRRLDLLDGEILIETAADNRQPPRPFILTTRLAQLEPLGTRFLVRQIGEQEGQLTVQQGAVRVRPVEGAAARVIAAGKVAHFSADGILSVEPAPGGAGWIDNRLVAERRPLAEVLDELSRYRPGVIHCQPEAGQLLVSGTFPLDDTDRALAMLETALPIRISARLPVWVSVKKIP